MAEQSPDEAYVGLKGTTDALLRDAERRISEREAMLDAIAEALDMPKESWRIAGCDALAHQVRDLIKNYIALSDARSAIAKGPFTVGEPEDEDGSTTVLDPSGDSLSADEIVTLLNAPRSESALTVDERAELERLRSAPYYWAQNNGAILEDSDRYRWFRDNCAADRQAEIIEAADGKADMLDHHIDKGRCGL